MATSIDAVLRTLKMILAEQVVLNLSADQIDDDAPLMEGGLDLDSIGIVEVIGLVEEKFGFQFQDKDLRIATFQSVRTLAEAILRRIDG